MGVTISTTGVEHFCLGLFWELLKGAVLSRELYNNMVVLVTQNN